MKLFRYSRWDGHQRAWSLDSETALDELNRYLMEGLDLEQSLDWMRQQGFELAGMDFRVMGIEELLQELRDKARELLEPFNMDHTLDGKRQQLEEILDREERALTQKEGLESERWNDFRRLRDPMPRRLSDALRSFEDHEWADADAEADYEKLLESLDDLSDLEEFYARNRPQLQGTNDLSYEQALELMRQIEALSQLARDLMEGNFQELTPDQMAQFLSDDSVQSLMILRDLESSLERGGFLREGEGGLELTPRAIRRLGELALDEIYASLSRGAAGAHETRHRGAGLVSTERSRPYVFGDAAHLDPIGTLRNALARGAQPPAGQSRGLALEPGDLEVFETDQLTETTTVLLLDMSWSMSWSGRWPAAKRVAVAMDHLIRTRYPRDHFFIVGFYTRARELRVHELPELSWNMTDPFTNLQDGLRVAQRLIDRYPSPNRQIIVITDGQPTAYFIGQELHVEWPSGYGGISPRAVRETLREVQRVTAQRITINTFMLDDAPELMRFVEGMTRINKGRAFYTTPGQIGEYIMVDYLQRKRQRVR